MQDNAPCHTARLVKDFFTQESISVLPWPAQSPDLNPIENLWALIKRKLAAEFPIPKTCSELIANVTTIWGGITPELCRNLADNYVYYQTLTAIINYLLRQQILNLEKKLMKYFS